MRSWRGLLHEALRRTYRAFYGFTLVTGTAAALLAARFRALGSKASPLAVLLQLPIFVCWLLVRPLSLGAFAVCAALAPRL